ncbi:hypothetical protein K3495_g15885, partial [Podosphaera aphanis]
DRRYHGNSNNKPRQANNFNKFDRNQRNDRQHKVCFVCRKEGCWSTRHSDNERQQARKRLRDAYSRSEKSSYRNENRRFLSETDFDEDNVNSFIQEYEGLDPDDDRSLVDAFDMFLTIKQNSNGETNNISNQYFHTECGTLDIALAQSATQEINTGITRHALTGEAGNLEIDSNTFAISKSPFDSEVFFGILIDTGAAGKSTAGYRQYQAFMKIFGPTTIDTSVQINVRFGIGTTKSLGIITILTPIGPCIFHIVDCNTPFLLSLQDLDEKGIIFNNLDNVLLLNSQRIPVTRILGHAFLQWGPITTVSNTTYLTETELRTLHRRFGHPSAQRLVNVLRRSGYLDEDGEHRKTLDKIVKHCHKCQRYGDPPMRFKFTLRD